MSAISRMLTLKKRSPRLVAAKIGTAIS